MKEIKYLIPYVIFTSFSYYFAKNGVEQVSPSLFMGIRYLLSGLILLPFAKKLRITKNIILLAIMTSTSTAFWAYGLLYVSPAESAVLSYSMPIFSLPIAFLMVSERPSKVEIIGIVIGFTGVIIYGIPLMKGFTIFGAVLTISNAVFWASFTVFYRKLKEEDPFSTNAMQFLIGSLFLFALVPLDPSHNFSLSFAVDVIWMATLGGALQFILWNFMVKISAVNRITVLAFAVPIFTTILGVILSHEIPSGLAIAGVIIMFTGIFVSRLKGGISIVRETSG
ncbi:hypothetical protein [Thermoplasma volcanium GSS1]|uniref:EamA domain-containing protein n=1 Tax=Thermoplasma volcanium (strain ATCC 51530 / DSM 4299 / JCM 9571 / NBRC 15438 / GSS1) TaxID=273116 RepID=Q97AQ0_THEVO|nr:DMT family transporter [Thermoplasma volcanium]BAB59901.1 hypothetical protein [Thermoplasma volcanium GSS1]